MSVDSYNLLGSAPQSDVAVNHYSLNGSLSDELPQQSRLSSMIDAVKTNKKTTGIVIAIIIAAIIIVAVAVAATGRGAAGSSHSGGGGNNNNNVNNNPSVVSASTGSSSSVTANVTCAQLPQETEGPYWVDEKLNRADLTKDVTGLPLALELMLFNTSIKDKCVPIVGAFVDIWEADGGGRYSDIQSEGTKGQTFLRGYQVTDNNGVVNFLTIWSGWYRGRTVHIHVRVRVFGADGKTIIYNSTTQLFFDDNISDLIFANVAPYNQRSGKRDTYNKNDGIYDSRLLMTVTGDYTKMYAGSFALGVPFSGGRN